MDYIESKIEYILSSNTPQEVIDRFDEVGKENTTKEQIINILFPIHKKVEHKLRWALEEINK